MAERAAPVTREKPRTPTMATAVTGATHPAIDVRPPFLLLFHPERWCVMNGRLIPALINFPLVDGVNNVTVLKDGTIRDATARAKIEEAGRMVIPWHWAPDGVSYMQCLDTRPGNGKNVRETWISVFETANIGARETSADEEEYADWLDELVKAGKIPACTPDVAARMLERAVERLEKSKADAAKAGGHGANNLRALLQQKEVDVLREVVGAHRTTKAAAKAKAKEKRTPKTEGGE